MYEVQSTKYKVGIRVLTKILISSYFTERPAATGISTLFLLYFAFPPRRVIRTLYNKHYFDILHSAFEIRH